MTKALLLVISLSLLKAVNGHSILLHGYAIPNYFACRNDVYGVISNGNVLSPEHFKRAMEARRSASHIILSPTYDGLEDIISSAAVKLRAEALTLSHNLKYPRHLYYLQEFIAKDYTKAQLALVSITLLQTIKYNEMTLESFARSGLEATKDSDSVRSGFIVCTAEVYLQLAEKFREYHKVELARLEAEAARISKNQVNIPLMKTTGNLSLFVDAFSFAGISVLLVMIALQFYVSYF
ncbi:hypothetical protein BdWA1_000716 [Babesia duncani]|uniref:Uncharacterized protein n=1 Tax=Babesia duncani TaxID=323732 RepID=A0AAD9PNQ1_9APIC|nr:hypothetical protein BdWA1_000716 [Babesia duncani]